MPWLAEVQRPPGELPDQAPRLKPLLVDATGHKITTLAAWEKRRQQLAQWWLDFLGPLATAPRPAPPRLEVIEEDRSQGVVRQKVRYQVEPGVAVEAYLLRPPEPAGRVPGVAVFHSTVNHTIRQPAGLEGRPEKAFGLKLAQRGLVALCPRNFLWPDEGPIATGPAVAELRQRHPRSKGMAKMLYDAMVAVDILASLPRVDPRRLGAVGHSLGAKEVLYLAALDRRIAVAVSSEGGIGTRFSNWSAPWYLGEAITGEDFDHDHHELLALVPPRAFLLVGGDSADGVRSWPFIQAVLPIYRLYGAPARMGLFNHKRGHSVPPEAERHIYQWIEAYL
ncbi:MAG TPA: dienelactone hydrolase [Planctomycetes bacterium]|nr:dienelactone hydrolase [Planctomycetota bacterium]